MDPVAAHELLVRLAGRLPDDVSWRLRDWLAAGAAGPVGSLLPRALLRNRIGVTDHERDLLAATSSSRLVDAVLPGVEPPAPSFTAGPEVPDLAVLTAMAVVSGRAEELRDARRGTQRVLVVTGADRPWELTGTLQRLLRVHGDRTPCVEVLVPGFEPPAYHQAAIVGSRPVWTAQPGARVLSPTS